MLSYFLIKDKIHGYRLSEQNHFKTNTNDKIIEHNLPETTNNMKETFAGSSYLQCTLYATCSFSNMD